MQIVTIRDHEFYVDVNNKKLYIKNDEFDELDPVYELKLWHGLDGSYAIYITTKYRAGCIMSDLTPQELIEWNDLYNIIPKGELWYEQE